MKRRTLVAGLLALPALPLATRFSFATSMQEVKVEFEPLDRPHSFWKDKVSAQAYDVLFEEATERAGSSPLDKVYDEGTYVCAACHLPLFTSDAKFDSGTGWPSFTQPIEGTMGQKQDFSMIWPRTEYHCARCGGHQGHVFNDGPPPRGERWCNNGVALRFVPSGDDLPELRG
ncbi:peptide-methionine (R)-S-oxide reductase MsrB [Halopseudomonas nanhaiensis]|uniref:peptide-methionine (R)-S-oxide reductase MsrB n=1 Tax=Halopseudomonas nanhaiensis TaxID=2830842 RepID=UPI001CBC9521|nr:peptide-methionine (R)-S-oxide reductase MsrB [Halopseudomonas nanhaiensis]UAW97323.1 peptide-methionine (R)-S-oxide reductase MsrB [Halopseudomonas nanhaiensis]